MKILLTNIVLFFICVCSKAQISELPQYYNFINKGEILITQNKIDSAFIYFKQAFSAFSKPFARDIYNYTVLACLMDNKELVFKNLKQLNVLGYQIENFKTNSLFLRFYKRNIKQIDLIFKNTQLAYNSKYRTKIEEMVRRDQHFRQMEGSYKVHGDSIKEIDNKNVSNLLGLIKKWGFPSEFRIGVNSNNLLNPIYHILIRHQVFGSNYTSYNFSDIFRAAVRKGEMENNVGTNLMDACDGITRYSTFGIVKAKFDTNYVNNNNQIKDTTYETGWGYFKLEKKDAGRINKYREEFWLCPLEEKLIKEIYSRKNPDFLLSTNASSSIFRQMKYKEYLHMKNNIITID